MAFDSDAVLFINPLNPIIMKIYSIYASEDGACNDCATNGKALFDLLQGDNFVHYDKQIIDVLNRDTNEWECLKFTYANVVKAINLSAGKNKQYYAHFSIDCNGSHITINELKINS